MVLNIKLRIRKPILLNQALPLVKIVRLMTFNSMTLQRWMAKSEVTVENETVGPIRSPSRVFHH